MNIEQRLNLIESKLDSLLHRGQGRVFTFSIVVGSPACNASCPFCISKMTGFEELPALKPINQLRFEKACFLAKERKATTVLLTGKGEPTLYPTQISNFLDLLYKHNFPSIELQTNAIQIGQLAAGKQLPNIFEDDLHDWRVGGLNTIAISTVGVRSEDNNKIYCNNNGSYPHLSTTISYLHKLGFSIRLCVMMQKDMVDDPSDVHEVLQFCRENEVEQCTIRPIRRPVENNTKDASDYFKYIKQYGLSDIQVESVSNWLSMNGRPLLTIAQGNHASVIYDVDGQNICLADCLTVDATTDDIRTLIFYPSGRITYDWCYKGAVIM